MSTLNRRMCLGICFAVLFLFCSPIHQAFAKDANVKDCLEGKGDCEDIGKQPAKQTEPGLKKSTGSDVETDAGTGSLVISVLKMIFALALILLLIYGTLKLLNNRSKTFQQNGTMQNLGGLSVGQNKSLQMVRIGDKLYLIGVGENVEMLQEITDEDVKKKMFSERQADAGSGNLMTNLFPVKTKKPDASATGFKNLFSKELDKLKKNRNELIKKQEEEDKRHE